MNGQRPYMVKQRSICSGVLPAACMQLDDGQPGQAGECEPEVQSPLRVYGLAAFIDAGRVHQQDQVLKSIISVAEQADGDRPCRRVLTHSAELRVGIACVSKCKT